MVSSDANRGNVAIIVWNTLEAPYVWDVNQTEYEGTINLGNSTRSLLSIYFRDYVYGEDSDLLKEAEYMTVAQTPGTDGDLGEKQLVLRAEDEYADAFWDAFSLRPKRGVDEEEATIKRTYGDTYEIVAYAPNHENLDAYYGKVVTVIFGEDNEVVSIRVVDETVDQEYLTAWEDNKLEIGDNKFKFATEHGIYMNTVPVEDMDEVFEILDIEDPTDFNKVIVANVVLNNSDKVTRLDLFVSGNYEEIYTKEAIVEKVRNEVITLNNDDEIDYSDDVDEDELPRVIKDGAIITVEEIEVGDVLTYFYNQNDEITTVYVSSTKVAGELTRASKEDYKLTVDGKAYYSSMEQLLVTDDKISDAEVKEDVDNYIGENVELYINQYGEYVLMASEEAEENWVFGIVTRVADEEDDEEDEDIFYKDIRVLVADGTTARNYKFVYDEDEDYEDFEKSWEDLDELVHEFIVFEPDANGEITIEDFHIITLADADGLIAGNDYEVKVIAEGTEVDDDRERIDGKVFGSDTKIFNLGYDAQDGSYDHEVSSDWNLLVEDEALNQKTMLIYEEDSKTLSYVLIDVVEYASSDAEYAIVVTDDYKEKRGSSTKKYVELLTLDGTEEFEAKVLDNNYVVGEEENFVEYVLSGSKLESAAVLIDLPAFADLKAGEAVTNEIADGNETKLVVELVDGTEAVEACDGSCGGTCDGYVAAVAAHYEETTDDGALTIVADTVANTADTDEILLATVTASAADGYTPEVGDTVKLNGDSKYEESAEADALTVVADTVANTAAAGEILLATVQTSVLAGYTPEVGDTVKLIPATEAEHTVAADATEGTIKAAFKVIDTQKLLLEYEDDEDEVEEDAMLGEVILDEDVVVYDARNGELKETTFSALREEVETEGYVYVIPFANADATGYNTADVEANILVIVD